MNMLRTRSEHDYERAYNFLKPGILVLSRTEVIFPCKFSTSIILKSFGLSEFPGISRQCDIQNSTWKKVGWC